MRIRHLLVAGVVLTLVLVCTRLVLLEIYGQEARQQERLQRQVSLISRDAASLLVLGQDYLLHQSTRASRQWRAVHTELSQTLQQVLQDSAAYGGNVSENIKILHNSTTELPALFDAIEVATNTSGGPDAQPRLELFADQLVAETRVISDGAFELTEQLLDARKARDVAERRTAQTTVISLLALVVGIGLLVFYRVLRPMARLEFTAQAVQGGDLAARSGYRARDEFGSLSETLDNMTSTLATAQRDLQNILDAVPSMIGYWDKHLVNRFANSAYQLWFGVDFKGLPGRHVRTLLGENAYLKNLPHMEAALRGEAQTFERTYPRPDGAGSRHSLTHYLPDIVAGEVVGFYALVHDVSDLYDSRLQLAAVLRENEALLKAIHLHALVTITDGAGRMEDVNHNFCRTAGYSREELLGQTHRIINSGVQPASFWDGMWRTIASGGTWHGEICNRARDGGLIWIDSFISPYMGQDGQIERYIAISTDITVAKQLELKLRSSEGLLAHASKLTGVGGWELDMRTQALTWSAQTRKIHRVSDHYVPQLDTALDFYPIGARETVENVVARCIETTEGWDVEVPLVTAEGAAIWVRTVGEAERENGKVVKLVGAIQDITERKLAAAQLQETNARFALACDAAGIGVWEFDVAKNSLSWDDRMYRIYGVLTAAQIEPYSLWADSLHPQDKQRSEHEIAMALAGENEFDTEFRIIRPDGEVRHIKAAAQTEHDVSGAATRMTGVNFDITERKRADLQLLETTSLLRTVLDSATEVSIVATDPELRITVFNAGAQRLLGYTPEEVVGHKRLPFMHDPADLKGSNQALVGGEVLDTVQELTYICKDGSPVSVSLVVSAMHSEAGELLGYLGVAHDVTRQKQYERSLKDATQKAEQANQAKSQFLANMSHEIRTPMNAVMGLSYLLERTRLDNEQAALLGKMQLASKSLLAVINDVLDLSKIEAGELLVEKKTFQMRELLQELASVLSDSAAVKQIAFTLHVDPDVPQKVIGDATRLRQILTNLVSNAIKFTDHGSVALMVTVAPGSLLGTRLCFSVKDTGIGLDPEQLKRLFTPFMQADASITRRFGGTGLGLSIVKRLTQLLGGEVLVSSTPCIGSEFRVLLDFLITAPQTHKIVTGLPTPNHELVLHGVHALVVDDSEINRIVAQRILELEGARITLACDGQEAVDYLRNEHHAVDVVLMDIQMPVLDGLQATQRIRHELQRKDLPIIALTAGALSSERERAFAAEMNDFITKPFDARQLVQCLQRHLGARPQPGPLVTRPLLNANWPDIVGLDMADVRPRVGHDMQLFRRLLQRLLQEFVPLAPPDSHSDTAFAEFAKRMHKLRGGAGALGAKAIAQAAGQIESACVTGIAQAVVPLILQLADQLQELKQDAAPFLGMAEAEHPQEAADAQGDMDAAALRGLLDSLKRQELTAAGLFQALQEPLLKLLGPTVYTQVLNDMQGLRYGAVAAVLEAERLE